MFIGITGSTGVLGKELIKTLKDEHDITTFKGDIVSYNDVDNWLKNKNLDILIHLASIVATTKVNDDPEYAKKVNYFGTKNLIKSIKKNYTNKKIWFFYSSTSHVYGYSKNKIKENNITNPLNYYGKTKLMSEKLIVQNKNLYNYCIGRIFSFTSLNQKQNFFIPSVLKKLRSSKKKIIFKNVNHYRDFVSLEDICNVINLLMKKKTKGIYNICSSKKIHLVNIIKTLNIYDKKILYKENIPTSLIGNNYKLKKKINWHVKNRNYLEYIKNYFK